MICSLCCKKLRRYHCFVYRSYSFGACFLASPGAYQGILCMTFHQGCMQPQLKSSSHRPWSSPYDLPDIVAFLPLQTALLLLYTSMVRPLLFFPCTTHDGAHLMPRSWCLVNEHHLSSADDDTCSIPHLGAEKYCRDSSSLCETDGRCASMSLCCCTLGLNGP